MNESKISELIKQIELRLNILLVEFQTGNLSAEEFTIKSQEVTSFDKIDELFEFEEDRNKAKQLLNRTLEVYNL